MKKRVLIYTDSRGQHIPRGQPAYEIFANRLAQDDDLDAKVVLCPMKWTTTVDFLDYYENHKDGNYDHVLLHTGIVDWSPRPQPSAINDLYNNTATANLGNEGLNTRDYSRKIINNKKASFNALFGEKAMLDHLGHDFGVDYEGQPTINMYSLAMAERSLLPRLAEIPNLTFINSNRFVPGWEGDYTRGRPANIAITEKYSELFRDALGADRMIDLLAWSSEEVMRYTCDNIHFNMEGSEFLYREIRRRLERPARSRPAAKAAKSGAASVSKAGIVAKRVSRRQDSSLPLISVIVPVYNVQDYLRECLDSLVGQDDPNFEVVLVDDGSTDESPVIVREYCDLHENFRSTRQENAGLGGARNTGLEICDGDFVTFVDSDDFVSPDYVSALRAEQELGDYDVVTGQFVRVSETGARLPTSLAATQIVPPHFTELKPYQEVLGVYRPSISCARLYRKKLIADNGIRFFDRVPHEDLCFTYKALHEARSLSTLPKEIYFYRQRANSLSKAISIGHVDVVTRQLSDTEAFLTAIAASKFDRFLAARRTLILLDGVWNRSKKASPLVRRHFDMEMRRWLPEFERLLALFRVSAKDDSFSGDRVEKLLQALGENTTMPLPSLGGEGVAVEISGVLPASASSSKPAILIATPAVPTDAPPIQARNAREISTLMPTPVEGNADTDSQPVFPHPNINLNNYDKKEFGDLSEPSPGLAGLYNKFKGERCFIIGNGPSLNENDLSLLAGEYSFGVNSFFYKTDQTGFRPTFFVVEDNMVMKENIERIKEYDAPYKFFPTDYKSLHPEGDSVYFFRMNQGFYQKSSPFFGVPRFSVDASKVVYCGQTVTYINLQLAFFMGFTEAYLIGMDFNYTIPKEHERRGNHIISTTDDPNHFHKDYFGKGKTWKDPKLDRVAMNYRQAKLSFESVGRKVYNATVGGKLEIFDRVDYETLLRDPATGAKRTRRVEPILVRAAKEGVEPADPTGTAPTYAAIPVPSKTPGTISTEPATGLPAASGAAPVTPHGLAIEPPTIVTPEQRALLLKETGKRAGEKLATLIIGFRLSEENDSRVQNILFLLSWIDHFYGDLFDVLLVEQDQKSKFNLIKPHLKPYVRHEFLYNPNAYNRGWGYNAAVRHFTDLPVVALMDTDVLPGRNFAREVIDCHHRYKVISPYTNIYFSDAKESAAIESSHTFVSLNDAEKVSKPTTITGGVVIVRRTQYEQVAGFEQYVDYGGEDRALDVTFLNQLDLSEIRIAPYTYVHLHHPIGKTNHGELRERLEHLRSNFGCVVDRGLSALDFIHKNCSHVPVEQTTRLVALRRRSFGDLDLYRSGRPLSVNGVYADIEQVAPVVAAPSAEIIFPPEFTALTEYGKKELYSAPEPDRNKIGNLYNKFKGKRCFIIGNGPSLNKADLSLLEGEYVFAVNSFFYKSDETGFRPTFYVVEDNAVMKENVDRIRAYEATYKFFPTIYKQLHPAADNVYFFEMNRGFYEKSSPNFCVPRFSTDASKILYCGQSVTFINLQLAFFMGFTEVYLIGMDFDYLIPKEHERRGDLIVSTTDDPNHFHKDYFGKGKTWKDPKLDRVAMNYRQAKLAYEAVGRKIYNATVGGKLEIFERVDYERLLRDPVTGGRRTTPAAPVIVSSPAGNIAASLNAAAAGTAVAKAAPLASTRASEPSGGFSVPLRPAATVRSRRTSLRQRYGEFALGVRDKMPTLFRLGQVGAWTARAALRRKSVAAFLIVVLAALVAVPFGFSSAWGWRFLWWAGAAALFVAGVACVAAREIVLRMLARQDEAIAAAMRTASLSMQRRAQSLKADISLVKSYGDNSRRAWEVAVSQIRREHGQKFVKAAEARTAIAGALRADMEGRIEAVRAASDETRTAIAGALRADMEGRIEAVRAEADEALRQEVDRLVDGAKFRDVSLQTNIERLHAKIDQRLEELAVLEEEFEASHTALSEMAERNAAEFAAIGQKVEKIGREEVGLDIVSALRPLHSLWVGGSAVETFKSQPEVEHGHALMMAALIDAEAANPGILAGKTLIEIGTTRERINQQGSTEKLAIFTAMTGMSFITVDMDPDNTEHAKQILRYLNPAAQAVTAKGEDYLKLHSGTVDFVYIDAFDFYHDNHSEERRSKYRRFLNTDISNEECWRMHELCAETILRRMSGDGLVTLDDTWTDSSGQFAGKGKLAVPLLLQNGFEIVARSSKALTLRRAEMSQQTAVRARSKRKAANA